MPKIQNMNLVFSKCHQVNQLHTLNHNVLVIDNMLVLEPDKVKFHASTNITIELSNDQKKLHADLWNNDDHSSLARGDIICCKCKKVLNSANSIYTVQCTCGHMRCKHCTAE